ncbi:MAG: VOC family protein [Solirubrobacterales bacterium]
MSEKTSYEPGIPCWIDLASPDLDGTVAFYEGVFGWDIPESENAEQTGGYRQALLQGKPVAGLMPQMQPGQPVAWSTYVSVADADATAAKVTGAGGAVIVSPMDVLDLGRMAVFTDPAGAFFGVWQPGTFIGAELVNEAGAFNWSELNTRDPEAAKAFYAAVFGWSFEDQEFEGMGTYTTISAGDGTAGGIFDMRGRVPDEVPVNWLTYFAVDDTDATVAKIAELGGGVNMGPVDIPVGRFAVVHDPQGGVFAIITPSEQSQAEAEDAA